MHVVKDIFYKIKKQGVNDSVFKRTFEFIFQSLKFQKKYLKKKRLSQKTFFTTFLCDQFFHKKNIVDKQILGQRVVKMHLFFTRKTVSDNLSMDSFTKTYIDSEKL